MCEADFAPSVAMLLTLSQAFGRYVSVIRRCKRRDSIHVSHSRMECSICILSGLLLILEKLNNGCSTSQSVVLHSSSRKTHLS